MNKAADIYWTSSHSQGTTANRKRRAAKPAVRRRTAPWWLSFLIVISIFVMLCLSINFRAFSEMREEANQNARLATQIQSLMDENLALQEEIHALKTDPEIIQREARKIGIDLRAEKVPVPAN